MWRTWKVSEEIRNNSLAENFTPWASEMEYVYGTGIKDILCFSESTKFIKVSKENTSQMQSNNLYWSAEPYITPKICFRFPNMIVSVLDLSIYLPSSFSGLQLLLSYIYKPLWSVQNKWLSLGPGNALLIISCFWGRKIPESLFILSPFSDWPFLPPKKTKRHSFSIQGKTQTWFGNRESGRKN